MTNYGYSEQKPWSANSTGPTFVIKSLDQDMPIGKYKGQRVRNVIENDVAYFMVIAAYPNVVVMPAVKDYMKQYEYLAR